MCALEAFFFVGEFILFPVGAYFFACFTLEVFCWVFFVRLFKFTLNVFRDINVIQLRKLHAVDKDVSEFVAYRFVIPYRRFAPLVVFK